MITHLRENHYHSEGLNGFYYSYENYLEHLTQALHYHRHNFSSVESKNLKLSLGIRYAKRWSDFRKVENPVSLNQTKNLIKVIGKRMFAKHI